MFAAVPLWAAVDLKKIQEEEEQKLQAFPKDEIADHNTEEDKKLKEYEKDEIAKHNTEDDLWVIIHGRVYNITGFQIDHPGGPDVLQDIAGQDATDEFENILHTKKARKMAKRYLIGKVKGGKLSDLFSEVGDLLQQDGTGTHDNHLGKLVFGGIIVGLVFLTYLFRSKQGDTTTKEGQQSSEARSTAKKSEAPEAILGAKQVTISAPKSKIKEPEGFMEAKD